MAWTKGKMVFKINGKGRVEANYQLLEIVTDLPRPKKAEEIGADIASLTAINTRTPGKYETTVRLGVGTALVLKNALSSLKWTRTKWMKKLIFKYGEFGPDGLLGLFRDLPAPSAWCGMDTCNGVLTSENVLGGALQEVVEVGLFNQSGYVQYSLPAELKVHQVLVTEAQEIEWGQLDVQMKPAFQANLNHLSGLDLFNGISCNLSAEPDNGSADIVVLFSIQLPEDNSFLIRDTEHFPDGKPVSRRPQVVCPRPGRSPIKFGFGPNGLDLTADVVPLSGEAISLSEGVIIEKVFFALKALSWI